MQLQENFVKKKVSVVKGTAGFHTRVFSAASQQKVHHMAPVLNTGSDGR